MKEKELNKMDLQEIFDIAKRNWLDYVPRGSNFVVECIVKAFLSWTAYKNYKIEKGKIYEYTE